MKIKSQQLYKQWKNANTDFYGSKVIQYAERWADYMESAMEKGCITDCAEETSHQADTEDIICKYELSCSIDFLVQTWEHGEELKKWRLLNIERR